MKINGYIGFDVNETDEQKQEREQFIKEHNLVYVWTDGFMLMYEQKQKMRMARFQRLVNFAHRRETI